jgi:SAM-dependent methyltransferase
MANTLEFTGERFVPGTEGEIAHEHWHRYAFARRFVAGRRVIDAACGEGYGSSLLAASAAAVIGIDIDAAAVAHARAAYAARGNLRFVEGSAARLPFADATADAVVSFETIEHLEAADQPRMLAEFARVLAPGGVLVLSSPNRPEYSEARNYVNPFHLSELDRDELARLLDPAFPARRWYRQRRYLGSALWSEDEGAASEHLCGDGERVDPAAIPVAMYFVVVAARKESELPPAGPALSLFTDRDEREWQRIDLQAREVMRQDALVKERDAALDRQTVHIRHLEDLVAERDRLVVARDKAHEELRNALAAITASRASEAADARQQITSLHDERQRLERAIGAQERIIAYRQSARWWIALPWLRVKLLWKRWHRA